MAAYAALGSLMHIIHDIEHHHSPPISINKQQVESLTEDVTFLQKFLQGYESPVADGDEADPLELRIADAAYFAQDVIESHIVDKIQLSRSKETKTARFFNWFRAPKNESSQSSADGNHDDEETKLYQDLQQVIEEMDLTKRVAMKIDTGKAQRNVSASPASIRPSYSMEENNAMVSSDDVLRGIMEKLVGGRLDRQVIPIVGMGGIGKTTLARTIYSKPLITEYFDICAWATVSQKYDAKEILYELLLDVNKKKEGLSKRSEDELGLELYQCLSGRRFLIVMDDMWSIDAWDRIQPCFPNNENGSRVLVTTRLSQLSSQLNNNYSLQMEFLDEVSSWNLFSKTIFGEGSCPLELVGIGKKIVENCRGLPLSLVVVGGLLKKMEHTQGYWESIRKNLSSIVNLENDRHCLKILKMSYNHLPAYLKPCFLYMGVFEEDHAIRVSTLIKLWVSEGFVKPMNGKSLRVMAKEFLKDLVDRNLILVSSLGCTGNIKLCKIHDLLRDLCLRESRRYGFYHVVGHHSPKGISCQRRFVIPKGTSQQKVLDALQCMSHARSVIFPMIYQYWEVPRCRNLGLLRTLHVSDYGTNQGSVNAIVFQCVNLQHLVVTVGTMPSWLSSLDLNWNLRTLIVACSYKPNPPVGIWKLPQLMHIEFTRNPLCLPDPPLDDVVVMENLHILKGVKNFNCGNEVVKRIPNVKKLGISYYKREAIHHDDYYFLSNVKCLSKLESLHVSCGGEFRGFASLQKLTFPHSLRSVHFVMNRRFEVDDMLEKIGWLPLLEKLKLVRGCFGRGEWEIVEGRFPSLKYLSLDKCGGLKHWTAQESSIFPRLEQLHLDQLHDLKKLPSEIGHIPTLQKIYLSWCSKSAIRSAKKIVDEQVELQGEELPFQVQVRLLNKNEALLSLAAVGGRIETTRWDKMKFGST
ncbi:putative late blight resistance protein homolog R1B-14 [Salvia miltiorrhiza]|uniref:putative late blight resistance protein homolog R1B-14 n=1 Tax=Salvia miltiorrhiza TaxID=226208 RepID=UPI0025AB8F1A|nr:putative late blight resistance protein homolog R1B-14 [Salvia miltiorrhiza]